MAPPRTKVVVRQFPPGYTAEQFASLIEPWRAVLGHTYFVPGRKPRPLSSEPVVRGRGYLSFTSGDALLAACRQLAGTRIADEQGTLGRL